MNTNILFVLFCVLLIAPVVAAQGTTSKDYGTAWNAYPKIEIHASLAMAHPFRFEDRGFGNHLNFGAGAEVSVWRGLRIGGEINRTFGLSPKPAECGAILDRTGQPLPCIGSARNGLSSATAGSITAAYYFGKKRVQPYLIGGISFMNAKQHSAAFAVHKGYVEIDETSNSSTGMGPTFGAGLRVSISRRLSIRPEVRFSDGTCMSSLNLSQWRISVGAAYGW